MVGGLIGILYSMIEPLLVNMGCFGYGLRDVLVYIIPIALLVTGYKVYSRNEK